MSHWAIYVRQLIPKFLGYPLWDPTPSEDLPPPYHEHGLTIGEVGMIVDGAFDPLFNACKPAEDPINCRGVPNGFVPLALEEHAIRRHPLRHAVKTQYTSDRLQSREFSVNGGAEIPGLPASAQAGFQYSSTSSVGAALVLPDGADRSDLRTLSQMAKYISQNAQGWFQWIDQRGIATDDLCVITGCDKSRSWGVASYSSASVTFSVDFQFCATVAGTGGNIAYSWSCANPVVGNVSAPNDKQTQTVFIRGFNITRRQKSRMLRRKIALDLIDGCPEGYFAVSKGLFGRSVGDQSVKEAGSSSSLTPSPSHKRRRILTSSSESLGMFDTDNRKGDSDSCHSDGENLCIDTLAGERPMPHPGQLLNQHLLNNHHHVDLIITHDTDWCRLTPEELSDLLADDSVILPDVLSRIESTMLLPIQHDSKLSDSDARAFNSLDETDLTNEPSTQHPISSAQSEFTPGKDLHRHRADVEHTQNISEVETLTPHVSDFNEKGTAPIVQPQTPYNSTFSPSASAGVAKENFGPAKKMKRGRGLLSCAECRRLKLKCDKTIPCSSCKRRGCSAICPDGSLTSGPGPRFVSPDTEKLQQKVAQTSERIRQLEEALAKMQSGASTEPHPLLNNKLLKTKYIYDLPTPSSSSVNSSIGVEQPHESYAIDAAGTLAILDDGSTIFYGRSAGTQSILMTERESNRSECSHSGRPMLITSDIASHLLNPQMALPFGAGPPSMDMDHLLRTYLPPFDKACQLARLYLEQTPWFFEAVTKRQLEEEMLTIWYPEVARTAISAPRTSTSGPSITDATLNRGKPHDLALLFMIFCYGALADTSLPAAPDNGSAQQYYIATKAALSIEPVLKTSVVAVQVLALMGTYEGMSNEEDSTESAWALMGMATRMAQSIGLHRDCERWNLPPAEVQKRRALFWELFITDSWQCLATGRIATFSLPFVDCELPFDSEKTTAEDGTEQSSFPYWKARFGAECVAAVAQGTLTSRAPNYSIILDLDRDIRNMELPRYAQGPAPQGLGFKETMSHFMPQNYREFALLYVHRCFFAHAIASNPDDPGSTQYAPSFLEGYRSAWNLLRSLKYQFNLFPVQIARFWVLWTHAFSSVVMISCVVTNAPRCKVAPTALYELKEASDLFESAALHGGRAAELLPIIRRLQTKAQKVFYETLTGLPPKIPGDIFRSSKDEEVADDMSVFSGKTHTVATRVRTSASRPSPAHNSPSSRSASDSPPQVFAQNPSFAGVHPSLVNELNTFDAQLQTTYRDPSYSSTVAGSNHQTMARQPKPGVPSLQIQTHQPQAEASDTRYQQYQSPQQYHPSQHHSSDVRSQPSSSHQLQQSQSQYQTSYSQQPPQNGGAQRPQLPPGMSEKDLYQYDTSRPVQQQDTSDQALRGIANEDERLQQTWQAYMLRVGQPQRMLED